MANQSPGLNGLCPKKSLPIILILTLLLVPTVLAFEFDNVKDSIDTKGGSFFVGETEVLYNPIWEKYKPIKVTNLFGFGKTLLQGAITKHDDICGIDCSSTFELYIGEDSVLIDAVDFYTIKDDGSRVKQNVRSFQFYVDGSPYQLGTGMPKGTYEVKLEAAKKSSRTVDWVIKTQGETLNSWAEWGDLDIVNWTHYQVFNSTGGYTFTVPAEVEVVGVLIVAGGGSGGNSLNDGGGGGGGAGGLIFNTSYVVTPFEELSITVGAGGAIPANVGNDGQDSIFGILTAIGGGGGGTTIAARTGGSGGGGGGSSLPGAAGTAGQGFAGGSEGGSGANGGGGGGASEVGENGIVGKAGDGGDGLIIFGMNWSGGGAGAGAVAQGLGGLGGGGNGAYDSQTNGDSGVVNTGGGGGGTRSGNAGAGGSGVVIVVFNQTSSVTLNSPEDAFLSNLNLVTFNATAEIVGGATVTNMSLWTNETGTWGLRNVTTGLSGSSNTTIFTRNFNDGDWSWAIQVCDSDDECILSVENRTFAVDTTPPVINITYPTTSIDYGFAGQNITFNWTVTDERTLDTCWYNYNNTNTTVTCTDLNASFILTDQSNITFYANDSASNEVNFTRSWTYKVFANSETYNLTSYETAVEGFKINLTANGTSAVTADLVYDGSSYTGTKVGNNLEMEFTRSIIIPKVTISTTQNKSFYWNITYGSEVIPSTITNQSVGRIFFDLCNSTLTVPYINFTFEDEETTDATNATFDTSTWYYYLGDGTVNKTLLYSTTDANESYGFCLTPGDKTMKKAVELQYSDTGYPQRRWTSTIALTNTTTNQKLYMLASADGTYSVYQVQTTIGQGIEGVTVQFERQFIGVWILVEEGTTDSAGAVTAWLNPDYDHRITFTKSGYTTVQVTIRPSSSTYTIVMSTGVDGAVYNSTIEGLSWKVYPSLGKILFPNTTQTFLFNITANLSNIVTCKMELINNNSVSLGITTGCNAQGGNLSLSIPLGKNRSIRAIYSIDIGDGYFILDADAYWIIMETNIPERGTILAFFKYARNLNEFGNDNNRQEYSRIVFFFLMLSIILGFISYTTGWDFSTSGGSIVFLCFLIILGSYGGFLTLSYTGVNGWMDKHVVALITSLFTAGYVLNKFAKET